MLPNLSQLPPIDGKRKQTQRKKPPVNPKVQKLADYAEKRDKDTRNVTFDEDADRYEREDPDCMRIRRRGSTLRGKYELIWDEENKNWEKRPLTADRSQPDLKTAPIWIYAAELLAQVVDDPPKAHSSYYLDSKLPVSRTLVWDPDRGHYCLTPMEIVAQTDGVVRVAVAYCHIYTMLISQLDRMATRQPPKPNEERDQDGQTSKVKGRMDQMATPLWFLERFRTYLLDNKVSDELVPCFTAAEWFRTGAGIIDR